MIVDGFKFLRPVYIDRPHPPTRTQRLGGVIIVDSNWLTVLPETHVSVIFRPRYDRQKVHRKNEEIKIPSTNPPTGDGILVIYWN